jgi:hypothetical protein
MASSNSNILEYINLTDSESIKHSTVHDSNI